jgi:hypothetical protein
VEDIHQDTAVGRMAFQNQPLKKKEKKKSASKEGKFFV